MEERWIDLAIFSEKDELKCKIVFRECVSVVLDVEDAKFLLYGLRMFTDIADVDKQEYEVIG